MKRSTIATAACALAVGLAACSGTDSPTAASLQLTSSDSLATIVYSAGQATMGDLDVLNSSAASLSFQAVPSTGSAATAGVATAAATPLDAGFAAATDCSVDSTTYLFTCAATTSNGLTLLRTFEFFDSTGAPMLQFNGLTTDSAHIVANVYGVRPRGIGADTVLRVRDLTVSGLLGQNTTRIWNGTGTRNDGGYWNDSSATRTYHNVDDVTYDSIVVDLPRSSNPWPASGSIARHVNATGTMVRNGITRTISVTKTVVITFNGTEFVSMMVGTTSYTLDLATGTATKN